MSDFDQQPIRARDVEIRNPFRVTRLPFIARLQRAAFRPRRRVAKRFIGRPARHLYRFCRLFLRLGGRGGFDLNCGDRPKQVNFDATNTQFGALFLPQHNGGYEPEVTTFLDTVVQPGDTIFGDYILV